MGAEFVGLAFGVLVHVEDVEAGFGEEAAEFAAGVNGLPAEAGFGFAGAGEAVFGLEGAVFEFVGVADAKADVADFVPGFFAEVGKEAFGNDAGLENEAGAGFQ